MRPKLASQVSQSAIPSALPRDQASLLLHSFRRLGAKTSHSIPLLTPPFVPAAMDRGGEPTSGPRTWREDREKLSSLT